MERGATTAPCKGSRGGEAAAKWRVSGGKGARGGDGKCVVPVSGAGRFARRERRERGAGTAGCGEREKVACGRQRRGSEWARQA